MHLRMLRLVWAALGIFLLTLRVGALDLPDEPSNKPAAQVQSEGENAEPLVVPEAQGASSGEPSAVDKAFALLAPLQPKSSRSHGGGSEKGTGFTSTSWYYAKEIFSLLFMNSPPSASDDNKPRKLSKPLAKAIALLRDAASQDPPDTDAIAVLAQMNMFGNFTHPRDFSVALSLYEQLATLKDDDSAQHMLGFLHSTGFGGAVRRNQAKALMYHTFAARGGNIRSQMTIAFRHHTGIGTPRNCDEAAYWYKIVADKAIEYSRAGPPGGRFLSRDAYRVADDQGGPYGEGASVISSGIYASRAGPNSDAHASFDDVLEYLDLMSRKGDLKATYSLGKLHYEGSRTMRRNLRTARAYFMTVARRYWQKDGSIKEEDQSMAKQASKAAGFIGRMFMRGEGMELDNEKALVWFRRGVKNGDPLCQYHLGLMHLLGLGVRKDPLVAADYFKAAADQDLPAAQVNLGQLYLDQGSVVEAVAWFELAARHGNMEAMYHLAEVNNNGVGRDRSCGMATAYYKIVAEKAESLHSSFADANAYYTEGNLDAALLLFMMAAEQGYESAQANVAFILDEHRSILSLDSLLPWKHPRSAALKNGVLALIYWTRSAKQSNIDSMVKMGDYYISGSGMTRDMEKAAACYQTAADTHQSAQALWNLGWIHENGYGVEQDYHLAKRFYDQAFETASESYLPVQLALMKLRVRSFWNTITRGKVNSIQPDPESKKRWSFSEWLNTFLEDQHPYYHDAPLDEGEHMDGGLVDGLPGTGDEDEYYTDDYDYIDENLLESLIILGLAGTLAFLVYYRHQRQQDQQQQPAQAAAQAQPGIAGAQDGPATAAASSGPSGDSNGAAVLPAAGADQADAQQQQQGAGIFPVPGDPNYAAWVAGGIGH